MNKRKSKPPLIAESLLRFFMKDEDRIHRPGDFEEVYQNLSEKSGRLKASAWYWRQVIYSLPNLIFCSLYWSLAMIKSYIKSAVRNIKRNKGYSIINISGLAAGLAAFILISLYVQYEFSYDRYHKNADRIYRVIQHQPGKNYMNSDYFGWTQGPLAPTLMEEYPDVEAAARLNYFSKVLLSRENRSFLEDNIFFADPEIFKIFSFDLSKGNPETALNNKNSIVITKKMAEKYFGNEEPLGKTIRYSNRIDLTVTGVMKKIPANSHFTTEFIVSFKTFLSLRNFNYNSWTPGWYCLTYCLLKEGANPDDLENKLIPLSGRVKKINNINSSLKLQPLTRIHLFSRINDEIADNNDIKTIMMFSIIALLILIIACINYMNLTTARSAQRSKEVGIRKVVGAQRNQLIKQFIGESIIFTVSAFILSIIIVISILPSFNSFFSRSISFDLSANLPFIVFLFFLIIITGILSGSYPALFISSLKPSHILKGGEKTGPGSLLFRNFLVVFQFAASIVLIICTLVVNKQLDYIRNMDTGYNKDQIVSITLRDRALRRNLETVKTELLKYPGILKVSSSYSLPDNFESFNRFPKPGSGDDSRISVYTAEVDYDFADLFEIKMAYGRNFSRDFPGDINGAVLINEAAAAAFGWDSPLGMEFEHWRGKGKIVGVVKNFNFHSLHNNIAPLYMYLVPSQGSLLSVRIKAGYIPETIEFLKKNMEKFSPMYPFEYNFFDDIFNRAYRAEARTGNMFNIFSLIAVFIACLGLFGLASFNAERRTREIGIRKVLGASVPGILLLLSGEFTKWLLAANVIAWPAAYFAMNKWLDNFAYRTELETGLFMTATFITLAIALFTIGFQSIKAANTNPVNTLKND